MIPNAATAFPAIVAALSALDCTHLRTVYQQIMNEASADAGLSDAQIVAAIAMILVRR